MDKENVSLDIGTRGRWRLDKQFYYISQVHMFTQQSPQRTGTCLNGRKITEFMESLVYTASSRSVSYTEDYLKNKIKAGQW